jgi:ribonuclease PH
MSDISSIFTSSADTVFGAREQVRRKYNNNNKTWFNKDCRQKRNAFVKIKNKYRNNKTTNTVSALEVKILLISLMFSLFTCSVVTVV